MTLPLPSPVRNILYKIDSAGYKAYIVGGAVRDLILNHSVTDWDFATNAHPDQIMAIFPLHFYTNNFGTVGIPYQKQIFDITTFRKDYDYSDNRRPEKVAWGENIEDDLSRRDFTINSIAIKAISALSLNNQNDLIDVEVIDPFGGQNDVKSHLVRSVNNPHQRFKEDALRMMRAIRIGAQLGFTIEPETLAAIKHHSLLLENISKERIRDELLKILASNFPKEGLILLHNSGLLALIIPELLATKNIKQGGHHIYDVWNHSLEALNTCPSSDPIVRLATLLHDIGKPNTIRYQGPRGVTFYGHEVVGAKIATLIGQRLKLSTKQVEKLTILVRYHMFTYSPQMTDGAIRRFINRVGVDNIHDMMLLRVGDRKGGGSKSTSWRLTELQQRIGTQLYEPISLKNLAINGHDLMSSLNIPPSKIVGDILNQLFEEVIEDSSKNNREYLLEKALTIKSSL